MSQRCLIVLHGLANNGGCFAPLPRLQNASKVLNPSMGCWVDSDNSGAPFLEVVLGRLASLVGEQRGEVVLLGHSLGGMLVGHYLASAHQQAHPVSKAVLVASPVINSTPPAATRALRSLLKRGASAATQQQVHEIQVELEELSGMKTSHEDASVKNMRGGCRVGFPPERAFTGMRTLVLHGDADQAVDCLAATRAFRGSYPGSLVHVMQGAGHFPFQEERGEFWAAVDTFIAGGSSRL